MAKRSTKAKRSLASLPKGLPSKRTKSNDNVNPFEVTKRQRKPKHDVANRFSSTANQKKPSKLAESLQRRQSQLRATLKSSKKVNSFIDRRIGEYTMSQEDKLMARLVKERSRRGKRISKFSLDNDDSDQQLLTHKGQTLDKVKTMDHVMLDSDEEDGGNLDAIDTELHFGGLSSASDRNPYGPSGVSKDLSQVYSQRKNDLDDMIKRRKIMKAEKMQSKEKQEETFESLDEDFKELSELLQFRDKEEERKKDIAKKRAGELSQVEEEMADWDREMKTYLFERRVKASDRTKTPEEIAKEEADRLQELETRRMARMNGDFEDDALSDISDVEDDKKGKKQRMKKKASSTGPEALTDSEDEKEVGLKAKFTADGLVYIDKDGKVVKKVGEEEDKESDSSDEDSNDDDSSRSSNEEVNADDDDEDNDTNIILAVGTRVKAIYRADDQYDGQVSWYEGKIIQVNTDKAGNISYSVEYDDGDFEEELKPKNVRPLKKSKKETEKQEKTKGDELLAKRKRMKAKDKARTEIPFVFEVPTTLEAFHEMVGNYAATGEDVSLIVQRIHVANSVRLNKRNSEKMQNFYDVLLRRFVAVGDALHTSGNGGDELNRYEQLNALTQTLYAMSQDAPESAGAVWGRRLGFLQSAHAKRLRDAEFVRDKDEEPFTAWPSTGTILLLRSLGHIFPVTDRRHHVVTPAMLFLGQIIAQTPVTSIFDLTMGMMSTGLLIEFSKEAKRVVPEAMAFLAGVLRLYTSTADMAPSPNLATTGLNDLRQSASSYEGDDCPKISIEKDSMQESHMSAAILCAALHLIEQSMENLGGKDAAEPEAFTEIVNALLVLNPKSKKLPLPDVIANKATSIASKLSTLMCKKRQPLQRRIGPSRQEMAIKSLAPRLEDPDRYSMSKDKGKSATQATMDRQRRELKREHKAVSRELRMDAAFVEQERRRDQDKRDGKARAKRNKNFSWMEGQQEAMNQQVRQGGGLLSGGGTGLARAKVKTAQMGIKKGGKF